MLEKVLMVLALVVCIWILTTSYDRPQGVYIDCSLASFHPDYTNEMRKICQELMRDKIEPREKS
jgi:hypothetical protein